MIESLIEDVIEISYKAYKKNSKGCIEAYKLDRQEPVEIDGITFNCWREYTVYKVGEFAKDVLPNAKVDVELDKNNSVLTIEMNSEEDDEILIKRLIKVIESSIKR